MGMTFCCIHKNYRSYDVDNVEHMMNDTVWVSSVIKAANYRR